MALAATGVSIQVMQEHKKKNLEILSQPSRLKTLGCALVLLANAVKQRMYLSCATQHVERYPIL